MLSIEKDRNAHRTLLLRAFLRQFATRFPPEYYDFLNGRTSEEPDWGAIYPTEWSAACDETRCLELGTPKASSFLRRTVETIRSGNAGCTVLLGGPPCQPYSLIGRSRNAGNTSYSATQDRRLLLYRQYVQVLARLQPAVAVMENVKGMLSARLNGVPIFPEVLRSLRSAGGADAYRLFALAHPSQSLLQNAEPSPEGYLVQAEEHGVPQSRHRVFVICIRRDLAENLPDACLPRLEVGDGTVAVDDVIGSMPKLRSGLSRGDDASAWQAAVREACRSVDRRRPMMSRAEEERFRKALAEARASAEGSALPRCDADGGVELPERCPTELQRWILDQNLARLPNNETRGHMPSDLARYLYAAAFGRALLRSPKSHEFPTELAPKHASWLKGGFHDRYRVQVAGHPCKTVTSHIAKDGHYYIHPDPSQCRSLTVREVARIQTFPDNYFFHGNRSQQYVQVGNAVPPFLAHQIAKTLWNALDHHDRIGAGSRRRGLATRDARSRRKRRTASPPVAATEAT